MGDFSAPKLKKVKVAIIGVGARGSGHAVQLASIEGVEFVGICDLVEARAKKAEADVVKKGHTPKVYFGDEEAWEKMLAETKPDAVFIVTPWDHHAPMCVASMKAGAHAFSEVPIACTLKEMWETCGWLGFIIKADLLPAKKIAILLDEADQLRKILGKTVATTKGKKRRPRDGEPPAAASN